MRVKLSIVVMLAAGLVMIMGISITLARTSIAETPASVLQSVPVQAEKNIQWVSQLGGPAQAVAYQEGLAYVITGPRLVILDVSDPADPVRIGSHEIAVDDGRDIAVAGEYAYFTADDGGLRIVDISDPSHPVEVGSCDTPSNAWSVTIAEDYAYVTDQMDKLRIIDVSDPTSPTLESTYRPSIYDHVQDVAVASDAGQVYAYVGYSNHLFIVDVTDPGNPAEQGVVATRAQAVVPVGSYAYVAAGDDGVRSIDVTDPLSPTLVHTVTTPGSAYALVVSGTHAYVADGIGGLRVINITAPGALSEDGFCDTPDVAQDVAAMPGSHILVADNQRGLRLIDVSDPENPKESSTYDVPSNAWSLAISGTLAYVGDYYYGPGSAPGALRIVDSSDPANPLQTGFAELSGRGAGVALSGSHAYVSGEQGGLLVVDVSNPLHPSEVSSYPTGKLAHDVAVRGNYAYLAESQGLFLFDISDPLSPTLASTWPTSGDSVTAVAVDGDYAYTGIGRDGLHIIDVTDPFSPTLTGVYTVADSIYDVALMQDFAYLAADAAGLLIVDVSNPISPTLAGFYEGWETVQGIAVTASSPGHIWAAVLGEYWDDETQWHNGLAILDVSDPANPVEVGVRSFPAEPNAVAMAEDGAGQTYIYAANQEGGLAILRVRYRRFLPVVLHNSP